MIEYKPIFEYREYQRGEGEYNMRRRHGSIAQSAFAQMKSHSLHQQDEAVVARTKVHRSPESDNAGSQRLTKRLEVHQHDSFPRELHTDLLSLR